MWTLRSAPATKQPQTGHRKSGLPHAQHHIPVQHTYTVHCATARRVSFIHFFTHEPHAARTERARTVWRETLHTRLDSRLLSKRAARLSPSSSALSSSVVCAFFVTEWHTVLHAFLFLCRDVTSCGSACTLPFLGLLDADLDFLERGGGSDFEGFLVFFLVFFTVFFFVFIIRRFVGVGVIRYAYHMAQILRAQAACSSPVQSVLHVSGRATDVSHTVPSTKVTLCISPPFDWLAVIFQCFS